ncbi:MAG: pilin [Candidatus Parcubacteria bacterium]|nr:pilin [Candidatus Parcubacteria bacterium]
MNKGLNNLLVFLIMGLTLFASFSFAQFIGPKQIAGNCAEYCSDIESHFPPKDSVCYCNPLQAGNFEEILSKVLNFIFVLAVAVAPIMIVYAGFLFMTAGGNSEKITKAKNLILWTVAGLGIILFSRVLASLVQSILGIQ